MIADINGCLKLESTKRRSKIQNSGISGFENMIPNNCPNQQKNNPGSYQNRDSKKGRKKTTMKNTEIVENSPLSWDQFLGTFLPSGPCLLSWAALGAKMIPEASPKSPQDQS